MTNGPASRAFVGFDNFSYLLTDPLFHTALKNTTVFALCSGWEAVKEQCQPTYVVEERDGQVWLDVASRAERYPA